jgi:hypothetical protein
MTPKTMLLIPMAAAVLASRGAVADEAVPAAPDAAAHEKSFHVDLAVTGGGLLAVGTHRPAYGGAAEIDLRLLWRVGRVVRLGLRGALAIGSIPWNYEGGDGEYAWIAGGNDPIDRNNRPAYGNRASFAALGGFVIVFDLGEVVDLDFLAGLGNAEPVGDERVSFYQHIPNLSTGLGFTFDLGVSGPVALGITARVDYISSLLKDCKGYLLPQAGLRMTF